MAVKGKMPRSKPQPPPSPSSRGENLKNHLLAGAGGALVFYLVLVIHFRGSGSSLLEMLLIAVSLGALGGAVPELIRSYAKNDIPVLCSWAMVVILIFTPWLFFSWFQYHPSFLFFLYGYLFSLLFLARKGRLKDV